MTKLSIRSTLSSATRDALSAASQSWPLLSRPGPFGPFGPFNQSKPVRPVKTMRHLSHMTITAITAIGTLLLITLSACGTNAPNAIANDAGEQGLARGLPALENRNTNAYGAVYPATDIGTGINQRIRNFRFLGYPAGDASALKTVALSDYYDPEQKHPDGPIKLLHIQAAGYWCTFCQKETQEFTPLTEELRAKGIVWLTTVAEGKTPGTESTLDDLNKWFGKHKPRNPTVIDPGNANLGVFYTAAALPWNAWIDARTMEIIRYDQGYEPVRADAEAALAAWAKRVPKP